MVRIVVPAVWTPQGRTHFEGTSGPLDEVIGDFATRHPQFARRLLDADGKPLRYLNICLDDDMIPRHQRADATVGPDTVITIISPMAGG
ncbi:MoaD/ThiS family protein [Micromonospora sp. 15K316]|uniref:MoaD/ThiS family protein n=1 Tax=Micromonospora sp. 15K316 TaxID=2530376 RepID=UPI00104AC672|nr:MoaD/ThiS family protein [Micromonospora sp. 15K316]TDC40364.1 MoaD/ThiS family protein [Micromonospora sp. 15K316]